jgi:hypothetical protein
LSSLFVCLFVAACNGSIAAPQETTSPSESPAPSSPSRPPDLDSGSRDQPTASSVRDAARADTGSGSDASAVVPPPRPSADAGGGDKAQLPASACPAGAPRAIDRVRLYPQAGQGQKLVGALIQGSNTGPTLDFVDLARVDTALVDGAFTELKFTNDKLYRWVKFYASKESAGGLSEVEFYAGAQRLTGAAFGTENADGNNPFANALDGKPATAFVGATAGGSYVGYDIGGAFVAEAPTFTPPAGASSKAVDVAIASSTPGAVVRYTRDGSNPNKTNGLTYGAPVRVESGSVNLKAVASADCYFDSEVSEAVFKVGTSTAPVTKGLKNYHIGNSLTDTINPWLEPIADSTGVDHTYSRWTMPGTTIGWIWEHRGPDDSGIGTPEGARLFDTWVKTFAPFDHMTVQPYADPTLETQAGPAIQMFNAARANSPNVQLWIYDQWPSRDESEWKQDGFATYAPKGQTAPAAPTSWENALMGQVRYHELFRQYVDDAAEGKGVLIVPAGLALLELKRRIDQGKMPGMSDFFGTMFQDVIHLNPRAQYLVALVFYSCLYKQTPEGHVTFNEPTLSAEQATIFKQIAWTAASTYRWSGI